MKFVLTLLMVEVPAWESPAGSDLVTAQTDGRSYMPEPNDIARVLESFRDAPWKQQSDRSVMKDLGDQGRLVARLVQS